MSAPPGWHPQPDGRERFWDGSQWTDQFRQPPMRTSPTEPTAQYGATAPIGIASESGTTGPAAAPDGSTTSKGGFYKPWMGYLGAALVALFIGMGIGGAGGDGAEGATAADDSPAETVTEKATITAGPTPTATVTATTKVTAPPPAPKAAITEGIWTVGVDIKAGTYKTIEEATDCYWGIYRTGTNGDDIIANDNVTGGRPQVTLKKGQDFENSGCGDWARVR